MPARNQVEPSWLSRQSVPPSSSPSHSSWKKGRPLPPAPPPAPSPPPSFPPLPPPPRSFSSPSSSLGSLGEAERRQPHGVGTVAVEEHGDADALRPHQRGGPGERLGEGPRARGG